MANRVNQVFELFRENKLIVGGFFAIAGTSVCLVYKYGGLLSRRCKKGKPPRVCGIDYPKDKVIVHCPGSEGRVVPNDSTFVMKLETYLRVAKIPYEVCFTLENKEAPKGKIPWIEYNGATMGDSQLIIEYLNKEFNVNLNKSLDPYHRAMVWAIQKWLEESTYWLNSHIRWVIFLDDYLAGEYLTPFYSQTPVKEFVRDLMTSQTHAQGVGRHSNEEVFRMLEFDLRQLSKILGTKMYLMGDELTELDCAAFGLLCQIRYSTPDKCPGKQLLNNSRDLQNLRNYMDRIRSIFWSDWEVRLYKD